MVSSHNSSDKILKAAFKYVDIDNEGKTDIAQFKRMMGRFGLTQSANSLFVDAFEWLSHGGDPQVSHSDAINKIMDLYYLLEKEEEESMGRRNKSQNRDRT